MAKTASVSVKVDSELKKQVEDIYARYGMTLSQAVKIFLYESRNEKGLPFDLRTEESFNEETIAAMREAEALSRDPNAKGYTDLDELFRDLNSEDDEDE
jgi:DNA-damage-inducible protein J